MVYITTRKVMTMYEDWENEQYEQAMEDLGQARRDEEYFASLTAEELEELRKPLPTDEIPEDSEF
jgi:hypothetical protein